MAFDVRKVDRRAADFLDPRIDGGSRVRLASFACAESTLLRLVDGFEERDAIAARPPARTGRPAVDAGRVHGIDEHAVRPAVAAHHGLPAGGVVEVFGGLKRGHVLHGRSLAPRRDRGYPEIAIKLSTLFHWR